MAPRLLQIFANTFLLAYAADALISVASALMPGDALVGLQGVVAAIVLALAAIAIPVLAVTDRIPLLAFVPMVISAFGFVVLLSYAELFGTMAAIQLPASVLQAGIASFAFSVVWVWREGAGILFDRSGFEASNFSVLRFLGMGVAMPLCAGVMGMAWSIAVVGLQLEALTLGFVDFDGEGVLLADRVYAAGDRRVRLVGMMHFGEREGYEALFQELAEAGPEVAVLTEGVTDEEGLLETQLDYGGVAEVLGLERQESIEEYVWSASERPDPAMASPEFIHADVDVSDFGEVTIEWLGETGALYSGESFLSVFLELYWKLLESPQLMQVVLSDIVEYRNEVLLGHIGRELDAHPVVVVPWGAMHMPGVAAVLEENGFVAIEHRSVRLISWSGVAAALSGESASPE